MSVKTPQIVASLAFNAQTSPIGTQTLASPSVDTSYRVSIYLNGESGSSGTGTVFRLDWTDPGFSGGRELADTLNGNVAIEHVYYLRVKGGTSLTIHTEASGTLLSPYDFYVTAEEL